MGQKQTKRRERTAWSISKLRVEVISGPDAGTTTLASGETLSIGTAGRNDLVLTDPTVSRYHAELERTADGVMVVDHGSTNGILVGGVQLLRGLIAPGTVLRLGQTQVQVSEGARDTVALHADDWLAGLRGRTPVMRRLFSQIEKLGASDVATLIVGESGVGKGLVARALHDLGSRAAGPFVVVCCAALTPAGAARELFGLSASGEPDDRGAFERARGGTLFLDEVGELSADLQLAVLGAIQHSRVRRVGGRTDIPVDVRVICSTHHDLRSDVNANRFRLDLYYRIAAATLNVPPLRERSDDIPLLIDHFIAELDVQDESGRLFPRDVVEALCHHSWPGNVRELRNFVEMVVAVGEAPPPDTVVSPLDPARLFDSLLGLAYTEARGMVLREFEARYLPELLRRSEGNVSLAARLARMDRSYLIALLRKHGLRR